MKFEVGREMLLKPLQQVFGAVEKRQTEPALANVLLAVGEADLEMVATDLEIELLAGTPVAVERPGETTVSARKLLDICKTLPSGATIRVEQNGEQVEVRSGRSRFTLGSLPADDFPRIEELTAEVELDIPQGGLKYAIGTIAFAMAQQDVRFYLNGLLLELSEGLLRTVATDGHRLSLCETAAEVPGEQGRQVIVPRKGVLQLERLLDEGDTSARVYLGANHIQVLLPGFRFTSKLIDGRFPDYNRVVPAATTRILEMEREVLRQALARTSILSNEKYKGVRLAMEEGMLRIQAHNPDQEEAEEELEVSFDGEPLEIGFNVLYLLDILATLEGESVRIGFNDAHSSCVVTEVDGGRSRHVVMPMRL